MKRIRLGKSGPRVSRIGLGVWQASSEWGGDDGKIIKAIERSYDLGINLLDTAEAYGNGHSETVVGKALRKIGRENFVVATKVYGPHLRYRELKKACDHSLKRLGISEIDLYQVHWPDPWEQVPLKHTMKALEELYEEGKIRAIGVSNFAVRDLEEARSSISKTDIVSNQLRYNMLQRDIEEEVLPYCRREGISILAWSPLAQGALTGKYKATKVPKRDVRRHNVVFARKNMVKVARLVKVLSGIAKDHESTVAQVALSWLMAKKDVVPLAGAKDAGQAEENAGAAGMTLAKGELERMESSLKAAEIDYLPEPA